MRELQRAAGSVSHTQLCNFFRHSTLISSCVPLHVAHFESSSLLYNRTSFVVLLCMCACTVLPRHPQLHRASRRRLLLRHIAYPPLYSSVMPNSRLLFSSRRLLPGLPARLSQFRVRCIMLPQAPGCSCCQHSFRLYTTSCLFPFIFISSQLKLHGRIPAHWFRSRP